MKKTLVVMMTILLICGIAHATDTTKFGVDSYVPKKFVDFSWLISGHAAAYGSDHKSLDYYPSRQWSQLNDYRYESDIRGIEVSTSGYFQRFTVPSEFTVNYSGRLYASHSYGGSSNQTTNAGSNSQFYGQEAKSTEWGVEASPSTSLAKYFMSDLFVRGSAYLSTHYEHLDQRRVAQSMLFDHDSILSSGRSEETKDRFDVAVTTAFSLETGVGRIYSGRYAFEAMSFLNELRRDGLLLREPSVDECKQLCDTILDYRRRHSADSRIHRLAALQSIAGYLESIGALAPGDSYSPLVLSDVWNFYPMYWPSFGRMVSAGLDVNYYAYYWHEDLTSQSGAPQRNSGERYSREYRGRVGILFSGRYAKPLSYHWQFDIGADAIYAANQFFEYGYADALATDRGFWAHRTNARLTYFRDSRTIAGLRFATQKNYNRYYSSYGIFKDRLVELSASTDYRISLSTTISLGVSRLWQKSAYDHDTYISDSDSYQVFIRIDHWLY